MVGESSTTDAIKKLADMEIPNEHLRITNAEYSFSSSKSRYDYHVSLFNQQFIQIEKNDTKKMRKSTVAFHVGLLQANPINVTSPNWFFLYMAIAAALAASILLLHTSQTLIGLLCIGLSGGFGYLMWRSYFVKKTVFFSSWGDAAILELPHREKCIDSMSKFAQKLSHCIAENALPKLPSALVEEAKVLKKMKEHALLTAKEYANAKEVISQHMKHVQAAA